MRGAGRGTGSIQDRCNEAQPSGTRLESTPFVMFTGAASSTRYASGRGQSPVHPGPVRVGGVTALYDRDDSLPGTAGGARCSSSTRS